jgi:hypothetical protein
MAYDSTNAIFESFIFFLMADLSLIHSYKDEVRFCNITKFCVIVTIGNDVVQTIIQMYDY